MSVVLSESPMRARGLVAADLDARQAERQCAGVPLPELLLQSGALTGPYTRTRPLTIGAWVRMVRRWRAWIFNRRKTAPPLRTT